MRCLYTGFYSISFSIFQRHIMTSQLNETKQLSINISTNVISLDKNTNFTYRTCYFAQYMYRYITTPKWTHVFFY